MVQRSPDVLLLQAVVLIYFDNFGENYTFYLSLTSIIISRKYTNEITLYLGFLRAFFRLSDATKTAEWPNAWQRFLYIQTVVIFVNFLSIFKTSLHQNDLLAKYFTKNKQTTYNVFPRKLLSSCRKAKYVW